MRKLATILVEKRVVFFVLSIVIALVCALFIPSVNINKDQTKYLAKDSNMNQGMEIINKEFPPVELKDSFQIMFEGLTPTEKLSVYENLKKYNGVTGVDYEIDSSEYNTKTFTMYIVHTEYKNDSAKVGKIISSIKDNYEGQFTVHSYYSGGYLDVLGTLIPMALSIMLVLLLIMCRAYFEPVLLLVSIGVAVLINMGSNVIFESVSDMTFSIAAVFQLVLSIDYSIILLHRYQQEFEDTGRKNKKIAMINALTHAFGSIYSSASTTVVGLLVLLLMSFTIGRDIGLVLAKGVALSFICVFTVMPSLILWFDKLLFTTNKEYLRNKRQLKDGGEDNV